MLILFYATAALLFFLFFPGTLSWRYAPSQGYCWDLSYASWFGSPFMAGWLINGAFVSRQTGVVNPEYLLDNTKPPVLKANYSGVYVCLLGFSVSIAKLTILDETAEVA